MAMAYATVTGRIVIPGTTTGIPGELHAAPLTEGGVLAFPTEDYTTVGPAVADVAADGTIAQGGTDGLKIPTDVPDGTLWRLTFHPKGKGKLPTRLGDYAITADADIADLVQVDTTVITPTVAFDIAEAQARAAAAQASAAAAAASAAEAEALVISDLGTTDGQTRALIETPSSQVAQALSATFAAREQQQATEGVANYLFKVATRTAGFADFQIVQNSFANEGAGAGTRNHTMHFGWNAARHGDSAGDVTAGKPAIYMGFEDNYYDDEVDLTYGPEWYVGYISPDGTTVGVGDLRPFYVRIRNGNTNNAADKSADIKLDIGQGPDGSLVVWGGVQNAEQILSIDQSQILAYRDINILGNAQVSPTTGQATFLIQSPDEATDQDAVLRFGVGGTARFSWVADRFGEVYLWDHTNSRIHTNYIRGATADDSTLDVRAVLQLSNSTDTSATAGGASALPATPVGYFTVKDPAGTLRKVPYYAL